MQPSDSAMWPYVKHLAIAWPGLWLGTGLLGLALEHSRAGHLFDLPGSAPLFAGYWVVGALSGYWINRCGRSRAALWVWLPPLAVLAVSFWSEYRTLSGGWPDASAAFFSSDCSSSECLGELLFTSPAVTCIAYSAGAWWALRRRVPARVH